jgi:ankyrin repeat protein
MPDARILTHGYDTHLRHKLFGRPPSKLTVYDISKDLLNLLEAKRQDERSRPLLFVCHSLGGIVVKDMLRQACHSMNPDLQHAFHSTVGIIFFGTPHIGADPQSLLREMVERLAKLAGIVVNQDVVRTLLPNSERLRQLRDEFLPIVQKHGWRMHSFQEALGVRSLGGDRVVEDSSSYLGLAPLETTQPINSNHMDMCRFHDLDDVEYQKVATALRSMARTASISSTLEQHASTHHTLTESHRETLLESLQFEQIDRRYLSVKLPHAKTCSWFLKTREYLDWRKADKHHSFLWVKGKPGAGKSTLMKYAFDHFKAKPLEKLSFFFHARGVGLERTASGMYRTLLIKLLQPRPHLRAAFDLAGFAPWNVNNTAWNIEMLKSVFSKAIYLLRPSESVTCFIDALDECDQEEVQGMVEFFKDLAKSALESDANFRVLFSSRHYPHITISADLNIILEQRDEHTHDIELYIENKLSSIKTKDTDIRDQIHTKLRDKASGVFMWVVLVVDILDKSHRQGRQASYLLRQLEKLPGDLHELFRELLERDKSSSGELVLCLQWVLFALRPLRPEELYHAILIGTEPEDAGEWDEDQGRTELFILSSSKGLTEVVEDKKHVRTVQFIHESVRDFLFKDKWLENYQPERGGTHSLEGQSHERLKGCCLAYIQSKEVQRLIQTLHSIDSPKVPNGSPIPHLPFLDYSTRSLLQHADAAANENIDQSSFLSSLPRESLVALLARVEPIKHTRRHKGVTLLYLLAENGHVALIRQTPVPPGAFLEIEKSRFGAPLFAALATRNHQATLAMMECVSTHQQSEKLQLLCDAYRQSKPCNSWNRTFSFGAPAKPGPEWNPHRELLKCALYKGDEIISAYLFEYFPQPIDERMLDHALIIVEQSQNALPYLLQPILDSGCIDTRPKDSRSPLSYCGNNLKVLQMLLDTGLDPDARDSQGRTPLSYLARSCKETYVLEELLNRGVKINSQDNKGRTPLIWAACDRPRSNLIVKFLLSKGAIADIADYDGRTPLSCTVCTYWIVTKEQQEMELAVAKTLLSAWEAGLDSADNNGRTPLSWAAGGAPLKSPALMVEFLLSQGAEVDRSDYDGRTPLSWAASERKEGAVKMLLEHGASLTLEDRVGKTPYDLLMGEMDREAKDWWNCLNYCYWREREMERCGSSQGLDL